MKIRKHKSDLAILFATLGLMALGLIIISRRHISHRRIHILKKTQQLTMKLIG